MTTQHAAQRVGVFVDVQNMYYSARNLYQKKVNFGAILKEAVGNRQLVRAIAYVIRAEVEQEHNFFEALSNQGFEVRAKDLQTFTGGGKKGDWDVGLAMDVLKIGPKIDVVVLVSGDGDYVDLVRYVKEVVGARFEVIAFGETTSSKLMDEVHQFTDMSKAKNKFLLTK
ncbi:MAG TPA: NYN domain-containing protein [bacterium]|nr:NYN domain-containing protein [bacterium]HOR57303.1 NYN domain-containing protein [bacterium]HPL56162.1 NYN domain-containing protein [bacterium]